MSIANRTVVTATGPSGASGIVPLSTRADVFQVSIVVVPGSGAVPTVQYTVDDIWAAGYSAGSGTWIAHPDITSITTTTDGNLFFPASAVRVVNGAGAGAGIVSTMTVMQKQGVA